MKSFETIANLAESRDYYEVAGLAGCSYKTVQYAVQKKRPDNFNIRKIFSDYLDKKAAVSLQLTRKYRNNRRKKQTI